jgi:predicted Fe-Mo cluster-binding NifX family protein
MSTNSGEEQIMKIALPSRNNQVDGHFGHCDYFTVFSVDENNTIIAEERVDPPEGCGCKSNIVSILSEFGVSVMLAGNMGDGAVTVLNAHGIKVYRGCSGNLREVAKAWLAGKISDSGRGCSTHESCL